MLASCCLLCGQCEPPEPRWKTKELAHYVCNNVNMEMVTVVVVSYQ